MKRLTVAVGIVGLALVGASAAWVQPLFYSVDIQEEEKRPCDDL